MWAWAALARPPWPSTPRTDFVDDYPGRRIVLDLQGTSPQAPTPAEAMGRIIHTLRPEVHLPANELELMVVYHATLIDQRALLLLDDAHDTAQVRPLLPPEGCTAIITSRRTLELPGIETINLDVLAGPDSVALLRDIAGQGRGTDAGLAEIAQLCGHLPLALRAAGGLLARPENNPHSVIHALRDERSRLRQLKHSDADVESALALSAAQLVRDDPQLAARWQMLSVFRGRFSLPAAARIWEVELEEAQAELDDLARRSLVFQGGWLGTVKRLHDLMRDVARDAFSYASSAPDDGEQARQLETATDRHAGFYAALGRIARACIGTAAKA